MTIKSPHTKQFALYKSQIKIPYLINCLDVSNDTFDHFIELLQVNCINFILTTFKKKI